VSCPYPVYFHANETEVIQQLSDQPIHAPAILSSVVSVINGW